MYAKRLSLPLFSMLFLACGPTSNSDLKEAWNYANDPAHLGQNPRTGFNRYETRFSQLPSSGSLSVTPWADGYWPTYLGGISYRWNARSVGETDRIAYTVKPGDQLSASEIAVLSPAEKFDLFRGFDQGYPTVAAERARTSVLATIPGQTTYRPNFKIPTWEGLCHAWAPAAILFKEPKPVTLQNEEGVEIPFGASDVKALLIYFLHSVRANHVPFAGERCNISFSELEGLTVEEREDIKNSNGCADLNAGSFHLILANQIGRLNEGFVADVTRDQEVWNQPVSGFRVTEWSYQDQVGPKAAPGTVQEVLVKTEMDYVVEVSPNWNTVQPPVYRAEYNYRLELDAEGRIIGGEWLSEARPDFAWRQSAPLFPERFKALETIYNKATEE